MTGLKPGPAHVPETPIPWDHHRVDLVERVFVGVVVIVPDETQPCMELNGAARGLPFHPIHLEAFNRTPPGAFT